MLSKEAEIPEENNTIGSGSEFKRYLDERKAQEESLKGKDQWQDRALPPSAPGVPVLERWEVSPRLSHWRHWRVVPTTARGERERKAQRTRGPPESWEEVRSTALPARTAHKGTGAGWEGNLSPCSTCRLVRVYGAAIFKCLWLLSRCNGWVE